MPESTKVGAGVMPGLPHEPSPAHPALRAFLRSTGVGLLWAAALLILALWPQALVQAQGAPLAIANLAPLDFGYCDATPGAIYTVLPAASPGAGACQGASAARFDITGDPNRRARITLPASVTIANGTESMKVTLSDSAGSNRICLGATGAVTLYVGGSLSIPGGGLVTSGLFSIADVLALSYVGGTC